MSIKAETQFSLKDQLFNPETVSMLSHQLAKAAKGFNKQAFEREVLSRFDQLELKQRIEHLVAVSAAHLPASYPKAIGIWRKALPAPLDPNKVDDDFGHFIWSVPGEFAAAYGCTDKHLELSLTFLREATMRFTCENPIRAFLNRYPERTLEAVHEWSKDDNYHVRRLASEGIRPFLPWAPRVNVTPEQVIEVLNTLYDDPTRYVTRSVANTLNDISKIDPGLVIHTLKRWQKQKRQRADELLWMTRHALRTQLKDDEPSALQLLGYTTRPKFDLSRPKVSKQVKVGQAFTWQSELTSQAKQKLKVTLKIYFLKANGTHSVKVFAVKDGSFSKDEVLTISKRQPFKPLTTRVLYPGTHFAELSVNGVSRDKVPFEVLA